MKSGQYGRFWKQQYKCRNLAKELSRFDLPTRNESEKGLTAYFPLLKNALKLMNLFWVAPEV
jgi:hypothetical protein